MEKGRKTVGARAKEAYKRPKLERYGAIEEVTRLYNAGPCTNSGCVSG